MTSLMEAIHGFGRWCDENHIPRSTLTLIINTGDKNIGVALDYRLKKEITMALQRPTVSPIDVRDMKIAGINVKVESPVHEPKWLEEGDKI